MPEMNDVQSMKAVRTLFEKPNEQPPREKYFFSVKK
jgi:hypothetical protein